MTHAYAPALIRTCLGRRRLVFLGDSNTRDLFFAMCQAADPATAPAKPDDGKKHTDLSWSSPGGGPDFHFFWDPYVPSPPFLPLPRFLSLFLSSPFLSLVGTHLAEPTTTNGPQRALSPCSYLNSSHLSTILANPYPLLPLPASTTTMTTALAGGGGEAALAPSLPAHPALLVLGSGLWYLREPSSGGIASWEARIDAVFGQIAAAAGGGGGGGRGSSGSGQAAAAGSKDRWRGAGGGILADQVVVLPVPSVVPAKLSAERRATLLPSEIDAMNADLLARLTAPTTGSSSSSSSAVSALFAGGGGGDGRVSGSTTDDEATTTTTTKPKVPPVHFPSSFNDLLDPSQTADGLHYSPKLGRVQAQLLYNLRCNDVLPKGFPMDKTCCRRYPGLQTAVQAVVLGLVGLWAPVGKLNERRLAAYPRLARLFPTEDRSVLAGTVFGLCVGLTYLSGSSPSPPPPFPSPPWFPPSPSPSTRPPTAIKTSVRVQAADSASTSPLPIPPSLPRTDRTKIIKNTNRPDRPLAQGEQVVRRPVVCRRLPRPRRRRPGDDAPERRRQGPRLPQPRADGRVEGLDARYVCVCTPNRPGGEEGEDRVARVHTQHARRRTDPT